jgi:hypothetical protein
VSVKEQNKFLKEMCVCECACACMCVHVCVCVKKEVKKWETNGEGEKE